MFYNFKNIPERFGYFSKIRILTLISLKEIMK